MDAVILAAGYATRLYPLTINKAKPLLPVAGRPIINYIVDELSKISELNTIYVVTNNKFYKDFCAWKEELKLQYSPLTRASFALSPKTGRGRGEGIVIINDGTNSDSDKLGAIGDIDLVIKNTGLDSDLLVVAGDNLFSFELKKFADFFKQHGMSVGVFSYPHKNELSRYGIVEADGNNRIIGFQEKPSNPKSNLVALCVYGFPRDALKFIKEYLTEGKNKDAPGYYLQWLVEREPVYSFVFTGLWHDIGSHEAYERAKQEYEKIK